MSTISAYGVGAGNSCTAFVRQTDEKDVGKVLTYRGQRWYPQRTLYLEWLSGLLTARSLVTQGRDVVEWPNANDLLSWIRSYCEKHPLEDFLDATNALFLELRNKK